MLVVGHFGHFFQLQFGHIRQHTAMEAGLDAKDLLQKDVDRALIALALIGQIVDRSGWQIRSGMPHRLANIMDMYGVHLEIIRPQKLHLLVEMFVNSSRNDARSFKKSQSALESQVITRKQVTYQYHSYHRDRKRWQHEE